MCARVKAPLETEQRPATDTGDYVPGSDIIRRLIPRKRMKSIVFDPPARNVSLSN